MTVPAFRARKLSADLDGGFESNLSIHATTAHQAREVAAEMLGVPVEQVVVEPIGGVGTDFEFNIIGKAGS